MEIRRKEAQKTANWSGGQTTEIYIYPEGSDYKERDFLFRLSTATVEVSSSEFTPLPGVNRTLMVLEGEMELIHEGYHRCTLLPLQKDIFQGGWKTRSIGECIDFNLMCREKTSGDLNGMVLPKGHTLEFDEAKAPFYIYLYKGKVEMMGEVVNPGDLIALDPYESRATLKALEESTLVQISIDLLK